MPASSEATDLRGASESSDSGTLFACVAYTTVISTPCDASRTFATNIRRGACSRRTTPRRRPGSLLRLADTRPTAFRCCSRSFVRRSCPCRVSLVIAIAAFFRGCDFRGHRIRPAGGRSALERSPAWTVLGFSLPTASPGTTTQSRGARTRRGPLRNGSSKGRGEYSSMAAADAGTTTDRKRSVGSNGPATGGDRVFARIPHRRPSAASSRSPPPRRAVIAKTQWREHTARLNRLARLR